MSIARHVAVLGLAAGLALVGACGEPPSAPSDDSQGELSCGAIGCGSLEPRLVSLPALLDETALATDAWLDRLGEACRAIVDGLGGTIEGGTIDEPAVARTQRACTAARIVLHEADLELAIGGRDAGASELASLAAFDACLDLCGCDECPFTESSCDAPQADGGTCTGRCVGWCASRDVPVACAGRCDGACTGRCAPEPGSAPTTEGEDVDGARCAAICTGSCVGACDHESFHDLPCEGTCFGACVGGAMQDPLCRGFGAEDLGRCGCTEACSRLAHAQGSGVGPWAFEVEGAVSDELASTVVELVQLCAQGAVLDQALVLPRLGAKEMEGIESSVVRRCATDLLATIESLSTTIDLARTACDGIPAAVRGNW